MNETDIHCLRNQPTPSASRELMEYISEFDAGPNKKMRVTHVGATTFDVQAYTPIFSNAQYLLVIRAKTGESPAIVVSGGTLFNCADTSTQRDLSLQNGILEYLKKYGQIDLNDISLLKVDVYKLDSKPVFETYYRVTNGKVDREN